MIYKITLICLLLFAVIWVLAKAYASTLNTTDKILINMGKCPNKIVGVISIALGFMGFISLIMVFISGVVFIISI